MPRLLRSSVMVVSPQSIVMPCPRGTFSNLRFVPLQQDAPRPGEVQVRFKFHTVLARTHKAAGPSSFHRIHYLSRKFTAARPCITWHLEFRTTSIDFDGTTDIGTGTRPEFQGRAERTWHVPRQSRAARPGLCWGGDSYRPWYASLGIGRRACPSATTELCYVSV